jgi:hypothetical protein
METQLSFIFTSIEEALLFLQAFSSFIQLKDMSTTSTTSTSTTPTTPIPIPTPTLKKEGDKRGKHVGEIHRKTRDYLEENNRNVSYREAFKIVSKTK